MAAHQNVQGAKCPGCEKLFDKYKGFHSGLRNWFYSVRAKYPETHISCAGRGKKDQEACFKARTSRAHWTQSAHNYNVAFDIFRLTQAGNTSYDRPWFEFVIGIEISRHHEDPTSTFGIEWYGKPGSPYFELPHCQVENWRALTADFPLVE